MKNKGKRKKETRRTYRQIKDRKKNITE